jgi:hypothetical protein
MASEDFDRDQTDRSWLQYPTHPKHLYGPKFLRESSLPLHVRESSAN